MTVLSFDLSTHKRLHQRWEYLKFFDQSQVCRLPECVVFRIPNQLGHFRLGITLKARGSSVERNQIKRQIREAFRIQQGDLGGYDYNVVVPGHKKLGYPYPKKLGQCLREHLVCGFKGH